MAPPLSIQSQEGTRGGTRVLQPGEPVELRVVQQRPSEEESREAAKDRAREEEERVRKEAERNRTIVLRQEWRRKRELDRVETDQRLMEVRASIAAFGAPERTDIPKQKRDKTVQLSEKEARLFRAMYQSEQDPAAIEVTGISAEEGLPQDIPLPSLKAGTERASWISVTPEIRKELIALAQGDGNEAQEARRAIMSGFVNTQFLARNKEKKREKPRSRTIEAVKRQATAQSDQAAE